MSLSILETPGDVALESFERLRRGAWVALLALVAGQVYWYFDLLAAAARGEFLATAAFLYPAEREDRATAARVLGAADSLGALTLIVDPRKQVRYGYTDRAVLWFAEGYAGSPDVGQLDSEMEALMVRSYQDRALPVGWTTLVETAGYRTRAMFDLIYARIKKDRLRIANEATSIRLERALLSTDLEGIEAPLVRLLPNLNTAGRALVLEFLRARPNPNVDADDLEILEYIALRSESGQRIIDRLSARYELSVKPDADRLSTSTSAQLAEAARMPAAQAPSSSVTWRTVRSTVWQSMFRSALLLLFAIALTLLSSVQPTVVLLSAWMVIPCVGAIVRAAMDMGPYGFPWYLLAGVFGYFPEIGLWTAFGLVLPPISTGPAGIRRRFMLWYVAAALGFPLAFGAVYVLLGLGH